MGRPSKFKERATIIITLEDEERKAFEEIRWRDHKDLAELGRIAILDYIKRHGAGNDAFRLDNWNDNPDFRAVPTISSRSEIWYKYLKECTDKEITDLMVDTMRINKQCKSIKGLK